MAAATRSCSLFQSQPATPQAQTKPGLKHLQNEQQTNSSSSIPPKMTSNLMSTEKGGEQTQYEGITSSAPPHSKSGGQLGSVETTTDPSKTQEGQEAKKAQGEKTAENVRYGQGISERVGDTVNQTGAADQGGDDKADGRASAGYGGGSGVGA